MYAKISKHPTALTQYEQLLVKRGIVTEQEVQAKRTEIINMLEKAYAKTSTYKSNSDEWTSSKWMADNGTPRSGRGARTPLWSCSGPLTAPTPTGALTRDRRLEEPARRVLGGAAGARDRCGRGHPQAHRQGARDRAGEDGRRRAHRKVSAWYVAWGGYAGWGWGWGRGLRAGGAGWRLEARADSGDILARLGVGGYQPRTLPSKRGTTSTGPRRRRLRSGRCCSRTATCA